MWWKSKVSAFICCILQICNNLIYVGSELWMHSRDALFCYFRDSKSFKISYSLQKRYKKWAKPPALVSTWCFNFKILKVINKFDSPSYRKVSLNHTFSINQKIYSKKFRAIERVFGLEFKKLAATVSFFELKSSKFERLKKKNSHFIWQQSRLWLKCYSECFEAT